MGILRTQQKRSHQLVLRNAANAANKYMTQDGYLKIICKTERSKNKKQHAVGCEYIHIQVNSNLLTEQCTAGVRRELHNQFITARNRNHPRLTMAFVRTVSEIKCCDVVSSGIVADEFRDNHPCEWTKQALISLEEATEVYMVEVFAESHC